MLETVLVIKFALFLFPLIFTVIVPQLVYHKLTFSLLSLHKAILHKNINMRLVDNNLPKYHQTYRQIFSVD